MNRENHSLSCVGEKHSALRMRQSADSKRFPAGGFLSRLSSPLPRFSFFFAGPSPAFLMVSIVGSEPAAAEQKAGTKRGKKNRAAPWRPCFEAFRRASCRAAPHVDEPRLPDTRAIGGKVLGETPQCFTSKAKRRGSVGASQNRRRTCAECRCAVQRTQELFPCA